MEYLLALYFNLLTLFMVMPMSNCQLDLQLANTSFTSLSNSQSAFQMKLRNPVIIDRKKMYNMWIYKNGYVTLGDALDEDNYPVLTGTGELRFIPFEDLMGYNIIASYILSNDLSNKGFVRAREILLDEFSCTSHKMTQLLRDYLQQVYPNTEIEPFTSIIQIDWNGMIPLGNINENNQNSHNILIFNSRIQSFNIINHYDIQQTFSTLFDTRTNFQTGIRSYSDLKLVFPYYDSTTKMNSESSSNIGLRNIWISTLGDTSYNIDFGWQHIRSFTLTQHLQNLICAKTTISSCLEVLKHLKTTTVTVSASSVTKISTKDKLKNTKLNSRRTTLTSWPTMFPSSIIFNCITGTRTNTPSTPTRNPTTTYPTTEDPTTEDPTTVDPTTEDPTTTDLTTEDPTTVHPTTTDPTTTNYITPDPTTTDLTTDPTTDTTTDSTTTLITHPTTLTSSTTFNSLYTKTSRNRRKRRIFTKSNYNERVSSNRRNKYQGKTLTPTSFITETATFSRKMHYQSTTSENIPFTKLEKKQNEFVRSIRSKRSTRIQRSTRSMCTTSCPQNQKCVDGCCLCPQNLMNINHNCYRKDEPYEFEVNGNLTMENPSSPMPFSIRMSNVNPKRNFRSYITLFVDFNTRESIKSFIQILYPFFHLPMAFYSSPDKKSNKHNEYIPNLSSMIDYDNGEAKIILMVNIEGYGELKLGFELKRRMGVDSWTCKVHGFNMGKVLSMNLENIRFEETSNTKFNMKYVVINYDFITLPEQNLKYINYDNSRELNIKWSGSMPIKGYSCSAKRTFTRMGLYFVKFSDQRYCTSHCQPSQNCQIMCLTMPTVFDKEPNYCDGNECEPGKLCINNIDNYECICPPNEKQMPDGTCLGSTSKRNKPTTITTTIATTTKKTRKTESPEDELCQKCSPKAKCRIISYSSCCICQTGYIGSGVRCVAQNKSFELLWTGNLFLEDLGQGKGVSLSYKQSNPDDSSVRIELGQFSYISPPERSLVNIILAMLPLYDIPIMLFVKQQNKGIYNIAGDQIIGHFVININRQVSLDLRLKLEENGEDKNGLIEMNLKGLAKAIQTLNVRNDNIDWFNVRPSSTMIYRFQSDGRKIFIRSQNENSDYSNLSLDWSGQINLNGCSTGIVETGNEIKVSLSSIKNKDQMECNHRCNGEGFCYPYCRAKPAIFDDNGGQFCRQTCAMGASCVGNRCVCGPGFAGDGSKFCNPINKQLECQHDSECYNYPNNICIFNKCECRPGTTRVDNSKICTIIDNCASCDSSQYEICQNGQCVCGPNFLRHRGTGKCSYDCSLCDPISTDCLRDDCRCKSGFTEPFSTVVLSNRVTKCNLKCMQSTDCPTNEECNGGKCVCPGQRSSDGSICQLNNNCKTCHIKASCINGRCVCNTGFQGNGQQCMWSNCKGCFDPQYCNEIKGCRCPPNYRGDGIRCFVDKCVSGCPLNSECSIIGSIFECICKNGYEMKSGSCVTVQQQSVEISILPPTSKLTLAEGNTAKLFCMVSSHAAIRWTRQGSTVVRGTSAFVNDLKRVLLLEFTDLIPDDSDKYICETYGGNTRGGAVHQMIELEIIPKPTICRPKCHERAECVEGPKCQCRIPYFGDGYRCVLPTTIKPCQISCPMNSLCDTNRGHCICRPGFVNNTYGKCVEDCKRNLAPDGTSATCHPYAICNFTDGLCKCRPQYTGNGFRCWEKESSCSLKENKCVANAACVWNADMRTNICKCDHGYLGNGLSRCWPAMNCKVKSFCGVNEICETYTFSNHLGDLERNGRCVCKEGYRNISNQCSDAKQFNDSILLIMGEGIISLHLGERKSKILYVDTSTTTKYSGVIQAIAADCQSRTVLWSGENGKLIRSTNETSVSYTIDHSTSEPNGKIVGIAMDHSTIFYTNETMEGLVYISDSYEKTISVLDLNLNIKKILVGPLKVPPGPIVLDSNSRHLYWVVSDPIDPRIDTIKLSKFTVPIKNSTNAIRLNGCAINLVLDPIQQRLCWMERVKSKMAKMYHRLMCSSLERLESPAFVVLDKISENDPSLGLISHNGIFYWGYRNQKYLQSWDGKNLAKINLTTTCCERGIKTMVMMPAYCQRTTSPIKRCSDKEKRNCSGICIPPFGTESSFCMRK